MKTILSSIVALLGFSTSLFAQETEFVPFSEGTKLVSFSLASNGRSINSNGTNLAVTTVTLEGQFGYFVIDNLALGINVTSMVQTGKFGTSKSTETQTQTGLFAAYYFRMGKRSAIVPEVIVGAGRATSKYQSNPREENGLKFSSFGLGYSHMITKNVGFDVKSRFGTFTVAENESPDLDYKMVDLLFGFQIYF